LLSDISGEIHFLLLAVVANSIALPLSSGPSDRRLILWANNTAPEWMTAEDLSLRIDSSPIKWNGYMDLTDFPDVKPQQQQQKMDFPTDVTQQVLVNRMLARLEYLNLNDTLNQLQSYQNRFYNTQTGVDSAEWIYEQFVEIATGSHLNISFVISIINNGINHLSSQLFLVLHLK